VALGVTTTFSFVATAPPASAIFGANMSAVNLGTFGEKVRIPVSVSTATTPEWGCALVSDTIPTALAPGEYRYATMTVRNSGSRTWPATNFRLVSRDTPVNLWNQTITDSTTAVAPGNTTTLGIYIRAPQTPGTYALLREMKEYTALGDFRNSNFCVQKSITVGGANPLAAQAVSNDIPTTMVAGKTATVNVTVKNTGSEPWAADGSYGLYAASAPPGLFGTLLRLVGTTTASGGTTTFSIVTKAPVTPGSYVEAWQMRKLSGTNQGFFGPVVSAPVTVTAAAPTNHSFVVNAGLCGNAGGTTDPGGVFVTRYDHQEPGAPEGVPDSSECLSNQTCTYDVFPGEEIELYCFSPGFTFQHGDLSITPQPPQPPGTTTPPCRVEYELDQLHCDLFNVQQDYSLYMNWADDET
jgi:hypothetical protein